MVSAVTIGLRNARFAGEHRSGCVCVFAGATSGIGAGTLKKLVTMLDAPTIYVIGRSAKGFVDQQKTLESLNPTCKIVFIEAEFSLLSNVDAVCKQIAAAEQKVDYLFMSAGMMPLNAPEYTKEGLETCFCITYYSRMRLIFNLLPLLRKSPEPRVLSVLNAGREARMNDEDIGLEQKWSTMGVINHTTTMMTLALEHLAKTEERIAFMHSYPGWVKTDNFARLTAPESSGVLWWLTIALVKGVVAFVHTFLSVSADESGERQAYQLTSDAYGPGASRIEYTSEIITAPGVLEHYRENGWPEKVWEYTLRVFDKALATGEDVASS